LDETRLDTTHRQTRGKYLMDTRSSTCDHTRAATRAGRPCPLDDSHSTMRRLAIGVTPREGLLAVGIGLFGARAFPLAGIWPFPLAAIALLLLVLRDRSMESARNLGLLCGLAYGLGTMYWLFGIFGALAVPLVALMAGYFGLFTTLVGMTRSYPAI